MATDQLSLYNGALRILGQSKLASVSDGGENNELLDDVWDEDARDNCLEMGNWNFATRAQEIDFNASLDPDFGFRRGFDKPTDWLRTTEISGDEYFNTPLIDDQYVDEAGFFFADIDKIYVRFVSNDVSYGYDLSLWPQSFIRYFEYYLAVNGPGPKLIQDKSTMDGYREDMKSALTNALSKDALNEGIKFPPATKWARARRSRRSGRSDLGSRHSLIG